MAEITDAGKETPKGDDTKPTSLAGGDKPAGDKPAADAKPGEKPADGDGGKPGGDGKVAAKPGEDGTDDKGAKKAPEKYELKAPDGGRVDEADITSVETYARENDLTNDEAQAILQAQSDALAAQSERFLAETKADKTYGGKNLEQTATLALTALDRFLPKDTPLGKQLRQGLDRSGYGNWLPVMALLAEVGKAMGEDKPAAGTVADGPIDAAAVLYGGKHK